MGTIRLTWFWAGVAALATGCGGGAGTTIPDGGQDASITVADAGTTSGCPAGSHMGDTGCESNLAAWAMAGALPTPHDHHVTFILGAASPRLYVVGGITPAEVTRTSTFATLGSDGMPGAWSDGPALPSALAGAGLALFDHAVALVGGSDPATYTAHVFVAPVSADGVLGDWAAGPELPMVTFHSSAVVIGSDVYSIGGLTTTGPMAAESSANVYRSTLDAAGHLGEWQPQMPLPDGRSHHAVVAHAGAIYVIGGAHLRASSAGATASYSRDVLRGELSSSGDIASWSQVSTLISGVRALAAFEHDGWLYIAGGLNSAEAHTALVRRARFLDDGTLGDWEDASSVLPEARAHVHQAPTLGTHVYFVGGTGPDEQGRATTFVGTFE